MARPRVTVAIPTLHGGEPLARAVEALSVQSFRDFEIAVVDNSGKCLARGLSSTVPLRVIENATNRGFGEAVNQAFEDSPAEYLICLNDDARPAPGWLAALVSACDAKPRAGMAASRILLAGGGGRLDSAGLALYLDGTAKQRGHGRPRHEFDEPGEAFFPSGCAALYRRAMLDETGAFDPDYFLYCEDTDLGLRGRLAGWTCLYVPEAEVEHDYSASSGRASRLKAFHVERNRLWTVIKTYPLALWPVAMAAGLARYWAHWREARAGRGLAGEFVRDGAGAADLAIIVGSAHWNTLVRLPELWRKRRAVRRRLSTREFRALLRRFGVSAREVARQ